MVRQNRVTSPEGGDPYLLSPMQQGMLSHRLDGVTPGVDVEQVIGEWSGAVVIAHLEQAWREVVARHAALRTGFIWRDGAEPQQVVQPADAVALPVTRQDYRTVAAAQRGLAQYLEADRRVGFPSLAAPLLRLAILRAGERGWLVTTYHHLILDARGMTVLFREVIERYDALLRGESRAWPEPTPYRAYLDWLQANDPTAAEAFWRKHLAGFSSPVGLSLGQTTEPTPGAEGPGELGLRLGASTMAALRVAARRHEVTVNTMIQAAWAVLLHRYTGEEDIVFGAVRSGRHVPIAGANDLVGLMINTVPVRVRLSADTALATLLRELRHQWQAFRPHEHTPLVKIQAWSGLAPGRALFETLVSYQEGAWDASLPALPGVSSGWRFDRRSQPNQTLALDISGGPELSIRLVYDPARLAGEAVARLLGHYAQILEGLAAEAGPAVVALPMLTAWERRRLLVTWNDTQLDYPRTTCVHTRVEAHAAATPERLAVADPVTSLSYGELNRRANRLAHWLQRQGVKSETLVAVAMERSVEMVVAWLGILKAGAAFVPVDPAYPADRVAFQLEDCGARVLLVRAGGHLGAKLPGVTVLDLKADGRELAAESDSNPTASTNSRQLAYVIYTSGSTGRPKGVQIEHRSLMNLVTWHLTTYGVTPDERATHLASPAFDASVWEIWPYLAAGASVHVPDDDTRVAPADLVRWLVREQITVAFMPTPLAEAALHEAWPDRMALRVLLTGGDKLKRRPPAGLPFALVNHYGPTECTVVATAAAVPADASDPGAPVIGRPIANTQAYVLDPQAELVPVGVTGELYLGGDGLARGYLRRPELTAERFVPNPFAAGGSSRLYRTGDRVRWTAAGTLEFLGRVDSQLKIRGCRIEPGEIEAALQAYGAVREALVIARPDVRGELQLAAYVIGSEDAGLTETALMDFLRARVPAYMVPASLLVLPAWPLTPNGKIDRAALPLAAERAGDSTGDVDQPQSALEASIARIFGEVLGRPAGERTANFFELGGHSLLAAQVITRLNREFPPGLTVRALFDQPTVAGLAREMERRRAENPRSAVPQRLQRRAARPEMELVPPN